MITSESCFNKLDVFHCYDQFSSHPHKRCQNCDNMSRNVCSIELYLCTLMTMQLYKKHKLINYYKQYFKSCKKTVNCFQSTNIESQKKSLFFFFKKKGKSYLWDSNQYIKYFPFQVPLFNEQKQKRACVSEREEERKGRGEIGWGVGGNDKMKRRWKEGSSIYRLSFTAKTTMTHRVKMAAQFQ